MAARMPAIEINRRSATPIYAQIAEQLRRQIARGRLRPGDPLPTNEQFEAQLQVARKTVQQAVATLAREQYVERRRGKGTFVKGAPTQGVVGIVTSFDVINPDSPPYFQGMARRFQRLLAKEDRNHRFYLTTGDADSCNIAMAALMDDLERQGLAGLLLLDHKPYMDEAIKRATRLHVPIVSVAASYSGAPSLLPDSMAYLRMAAEYLAQHNRKRVAVIYTKPNREYMPSAAKLSKLIHAAGCETRREWLIDDAPYEPLGCSALARLPLDKLDGLIVGDDVLALGVDRYLCEAGVTSSSDLLVTTWWNQGLGLSLRLPFVRIGWDVDQMAAEAIDMLDQVMTGRRLHAPRRLAEPRLLGPA